VRVALRVQGDVGDGPEALLDLLAVAEEAELAGRDGGRHDVQLLVHLQRRRDGIG
jgi:hypothetical protein